MEKYSFSVEIASDYYKEVNSLQSSSDVNNWVSPWLGYNNQQGGCSFVNSTYDCVVNDGNQVMAFTFNVEDKEFISNSGFTPESITYVWNNTFNMYNFNVSGSSLSLSLFGDGFLAMNYGMEDSMFNRLYFYNGFGLDRFELFSSEYGLNGDKILIYKIKW